MMFTDFLVPLGGGIAKTATDPDPGGPIKSGGTLLVKVRRRRNTKARWTKASMTGISTRAPMIQVAEGLDILVMDSRRKGEKIISLITDFWKVLSSVILELFPS